MEQQQVSAAIHLQLQSFPPHAVSWPSRHIQYHTLLNFKQHRQHLNDGEMWQHTPVEDDTRRRASCDGQHSKHTSEDNVSQRMHQDSGYESCSYSPRASISRSRPPIVRQNSNMSTTQLRSRPSTRRSSKPYNTSRNGSVYKVQSYDTSQPSTAYYQFPALDVVELTETATPSDISPPLPQTTHYWTSDSTRRLEYAAIDAASRGVKGWIKKHLVPECMVGPQHVHFDDDSGSVRRFRLELDDDHAEKNSAHNRKGWQFWKD